MWMVSMCIQYIKKTSVFTKHHSLVKERYHDIVFWFIYYIKSWINILTISFLIFEFVESTVMFPVYADLHESWSNVSLELVMITIDSIFSVCPVFLTTQSTFKSPVYTHSLTCMPIWCNSQFSVLPKETWSGNSPTLRLPDNHSSTHSILSVWCIDRH